jgi:AraC-like DNA-binding protein
MVYNVPRAHTSQELTQLVVQLFTQLTAALDQAPTKCIYSIQEVISYIQAHFREQTLDVSRICDVFHISYSYLSRSFKEQTGVGLLDYVQLIRLEAAKQLLCSSNYHMDKIAHCVGFNGRWSLQRVFQKYESTTPSQYRAQQTSTAP